jgi:hypothetical protein
MFEMLVDMIVEDEKERLDHVTRFLGQEFGSFVSDNMALVDAQKIDWRSIYYLEMLL